MQKLVRKRAGKAGLSPGSLVYTGEPREGPVDVGLLRYDRAGARYQPGLEGAGLRPPEGSGAVTWISVRGLYDLEVIRQVAEAFDLHPLTTEDVVSVGQRPKVEFYDHYVYIVLRTLGFGEGEGGIREEQVSLVLGDGWVISFQESPDSRAFEPVRQRIVEGKGKIRQHGADYLAYSLMDVIVDDYFLVLERFGSRLETLESDVLERPGADILARINRSRREALLLRRAVWPLREVLAACGRDEATLISSPVKTYLRDVYDHTIEVIDTVEAFRDILTGVLEVYLSSLSSRSNEIMKVLTIIATLFIPLTFIVGVYGMNFDRMPELHWRWGYPAVWLLMVLVTGGLIAYFKRKDWL